MQEYNRGRDQGLDMAWRLLKDAGEEKAAKISTVKDIYEKLGVGEDAKEEIKRLHTQAMAHIDALNLTEEKANTLRNYAATLLGRNK